MPRIILSMIVKDEAPVIRRCLNSVKPIIDGYHIVDTGSSDDTVSIIQEELQHLPGKISHSKWTNDFSLHRNEALCGIINGDYALAIDADDELKIQPFFNKGFLDEQAYAIAHYRKEECKNYRTILFIPDGLRWKGIRHERVVGMNRSAILPALSVKVHDEGNRSKTNKFQDDIDAILHAIINNENFDGCDIFNLAQSYKDAGHDKKAIETYQKFINYYGGQDYKEMRCVASIMCAALEEKGDGAKTQEYLERAIAIDNSRIEPYVYLAQYFLKHNQFKAAFQASHQAVSLKQTFHYLNEMTNLWTDARFEVYDLCKKKLDENDRLMSSLKPGV